MRVEDLLDDLIRKEGGYVNDPDDRGGPTKYGVTQATLSSYRGYQVTAQEVRALPLEEAKEIYLDRYYYSKRINELVTSIRPQVFDMGVNAGPRRAIRLLQSMMNRTGIVRVITDGRIGPQTVKAAKKCHSAMGVYFINAYVDERNLYYKRLVAIRPRNGKFLRGWLNRSESFRVFV